ncbi:MAG: DUF2164 family protein [Peptostreptococcaceae bacterium]|nr:DUF2164 family protein [Peptostreptococcaceae bacterium]
MKKNDKIKLIKEKKKEMIAETKNYFSNERNEEIGDLASNLILDFIIEKFGHSRWLINV